MKRLHPHPAAALAATLLWLTASLAPAEIRHVLHISVDGLRGDLLKERMEADPAGHPNFMRLRMEGASTCNARCDFDFSATLPNHTGMITGRPVLNPPDNATAGHNYTSNNYTGSATGGDSIHQLGDAPYSYKVSTFDMSHDRGLSTALYGGKTRFFLYAHSYNATKGRTDTVGADDGTNKVDFVSLADLSAPATLPSVKTAVVADIAAGTLRRYNLIHFADLDMGQTTGGHYVGWGSPGWYQGVMNVDGYLGAIFDALDAANPSIKGKVAIVLTADHGGGSPGTNHLDPTKAANYRIPLFIWGPGIPPGIDAHRLFANRWDPGDARPGNSVVVPQPMRNADSANIAMLLLGLPPVEGSYYLPQPAAALHITRLAQHVEISWPSYLTGYVLQSTLNLQTGPWTADVGEPTEHGGMFVRLLPVQSEENQRFWRLIPPA
ncbi:MAG: alkaline phosphatase family protein [Verrucomicrobiales bacterium]|nr:alkaline phosphatase family protein [Verrucomicrobiales bacterium]